MDETGRVGFHCPLLVSVTADRPIFGLRDRPRNRPAELHAGHHSQHQARSMLLFIIAQCPLLLPSLRHHL